MIRFDKTLAAALLAAALAAEGAWAGFCGPLTDPHTTLVEVSPGANLASVVSKAAAGTTILLRPGTYKVSTMIQFLKPDVTLRSKTGNRADVVLDGNLGTTPLDRTKFLGEIVQVRSSGVVLADITIRYAKYHAVHVFPASGTFINGFMMHNVRAYDTGEQIVKVNSSGSTNTGWADNGTIQCSTIEFVDNSVMEPMGTNYYTGGLDVHGGQGWKVRHNLFRNIQRGGRSMEHAIHFWSKSRGTVIENNRIENCYRGIGLGMKTSQSGPLRSYPDGLGNSPYYDHIGGIVRNNVIWNRPGIKMETGIALWNTLNDEVYHNTVHSADAPFSGIEYRFANTRATIRNNLVGQRIMKRDNAVATLSNNVEYASTSSYKSFSTGDLHLGSGTYSAIVDKAMVLASGKAGVDMDEQARGSLPDIGADERVAAVGKVGGGIETEGAVLAPLMGELPAGAKAHDTRGRRLLRNDGGALPQTRGMRVVRP